MGKKKTKNCSKPKDAPATLEPVTTSLGARIDGKSEKAVANGSIEHYRMKSISERDAKDFFYRNHNHNTSLYGRRFSLGAFDQEGIMRGAIAVVIRDKSKTVRQADKTVEILRCCSDGCNPRLVGTLISDAKRAVQALGYRKITINRLAFNGPEKPTYPLPPEGT